MMPNADRPGSEEPLPVSILGQGGYLIASIDTALDDGELLHFRDDLLEKIGAHRSREVIIDVAALDVIDSFACHTLRSVAQVARLRGTETVIVGINPVVALAMVRLGASLEPVRTALDLEEALEQLESQKSSQFRPGADPR
jgi:rsbT antagonist protein RsbS